MRTTGGTEWSNKNAFKLQRNNSLFSCHTHTHTYGRHAWLHLQNTAGETCELIEGERQILLASVPPGRHTSPPARSLAQPPSLSLHFIISCFTSSTLLSFLVSHTLSINPRPTHTHTEWHFFYHQKPISHPSTSSCSLWYPSFSCFSYSFHQSSHLFQLLFGFSVCESFQDSFFDSHEYLCFVG